MSAAVLVLFFAVLVPLTVTVAWAHRTVLDTDAWVRTVRPIAADPAVTAAVSRQVTDQLYAALDPQQTVAEALPPKAAFLAGPITNGTKSYVQQAVDKVLNSDQFQTLWVEANRFAHAQLVTVLRGDTTVLKTTGDQVVLNLVPLVNAALVNIQGFVSSVVGKDVTLPAITGDELPSAACDKIATALDRPIPPTCGQIALFPADKLNRAQDAVRTFDRLALALLIITPLVFLGALVASQRRRRTLLQLTVGGMFGLIIVRRVMYWLQDQLVSAGRPENKDARSAIAHDVLRGFFSISEWFLIGGLVIVALALVTGPYRWAVATRRGVRRGATELGQLTSTAVSGATATARDESTLAWVRGHFDLLRVSGVVLALFLMLVFSVNFWGFLVIAALLAVYEFWLYRLRPPPGPPPAITLPPTSPPSPSQQ